MKEHYRNYDPDEVDRRGKKTSERRVLHIVSTALSFEAMKDAIIFTFDDHPIIPELVKNRIAKLDKLFEENGISLGDKRKMKKLRELQDLLKRNLQKRNQENEIDDLMGWVCGYCNRLTFSSFSLILIYYNVTFSFSLIVIYWSLLIKLVIRKLLKD